MPGPIEEFNRLDRRQQLQLLSSVCSSPAWSHQLQARGPFVDLDELLDQADQVVATLPDVEIDAALDGHPRIGDRPDNPSSVREQAGMATAGAALRAELAAKNRAYEEKFGYVYLVCASGRSAEELLGILTGRLSNDAETERTVMRGELAKINRLRLARLL